MANKSQSQAVLLKELHDLQEKYDALKDSGKKEHKEPGEEVVALLQSERLMKEALAVARLGTYVWDISTGYWKSSEILDEIFGIDKKYLRTLDGWSSLIHPDWRDKMTKYVTNEVIGKRQRFDKEYIIVRHKDGQERWVHGLGEVEFDNQNKPKILIGTITDITERRNYEKNLRESELRFSQFSNASFEGIGLSDKEYLIDANEQLSVLLGYSHEELIGKKVLDFVAPESRKIVSQNRQTESPLPYEHMAIRKDGKIFPVEIQSRKMTYKGQVVRVTAIRDITRRKWVEEALREANQKLKLHFERTPMAVIELDLDFRITQWNPSAQVIFGFTQQEALGKHVSFIVPTGIRPVVEKVLTDLINNKGGERSTNQNIRKDNQVIYCEWYNTSLIDEKGKVTGVASIVHDISDRKKAEEALNESEKKFRQFVEIANEGIIAADRYDKITFLNQRMAEMIGYSKEELLGRHFNTFIFPEEIDDYKQRMKYRRKGIGEVFERKYKRKDGTILWALVSASPILGADGKYIGSFGMLTDITDRKAAHEILRESEERFRSVAESANDAIITLNSKGMISGWNRGAVKIFGYNVEEITGYDIELIIPQLSVENQEICIKSDDPGKKYNFTGKTVELEGMGKTGKEFPLEISLAEWETSTGKFFTGIIRNITDRKKAEQALIQAKEKAEESDRLKTAFLANMSHEVRTPMNGIMGFAGLLKNPSITLNEKHEYISLIESSGARMLNILNDLIDISKIESGQMEIYNSNCNLNKITNFIFAFFKPEVEQKGLKLSLQIGLSEDDANIVTDEEKLNAILINLVKNAVKFTREGHIEFGYVLKTGDGEKESMASKSPEIEFFVKDTGVGIKEEQKEIIFERFRQGSESLTRNYEGAGLGLSISKSYVKMLGGKIRVENNLDKNKNQPKGSIFYFTLPYIRETASQISIIKENSQTDELLGISKLKILITEDHEPSEKLLSRIVRDFSEKIIIAKTGLEAVSACRKNPEIDLILMDIKMPEMDGFEATRQIRHFNKQVVIIAQTAYTQPGDKEKAYNAGCNEFISKPLNKALLLTLIQKYFTKKESFE